MTEQVTCERCPEVYPVDEGCPHDWFLCPACLPSCSQCVNDLTDDMAGEGV